VSGLFPDAGIGIRIDEPADGGASLPWRLNLRRRSSGRGACR